MNRRRLAAVAVLLVVGATLGYLALRPERLPPPPTEEDLSALVARRDALQERLRQLVVANGEKSLAVAPRGGVMIGIPTRFTSEIVAEVVSGLFDHMTLTLRNLKVHKEGEVKAKVVLVRKTVGRYVLDVAIHEVQGVLAPGRPELTFGEDSVGITLPVSLVEGTGRSDIRLQWDSKGLLANTVCGDTDVTKAVTGSVIPQDYVLKGLFRITGEGEAITLRPDFPEELQVRIFVDPSEQAWQAVQEVVDDQRGGCRVALDKIDIKEILGGIVERGFNVKIPQKVIKPVRLPAGVRQSLELQGVHVGLEVRSTGLRVARDRLWYGADVNLELGAARAGPSESAAPAR